MAHQKNNGTTKQISMTTQNYWRHRIQHMPMHQYYPLLHKNWGQV